MKRQIIQYWHSMIATNSYVNTCCCFSHISDYLLVGVEYCSMTGKVTLTLSSLQRWKFEVINYLLQHTSVTKTLYIIVDVYITIKCQVIGKTTIQSIHGIIIIFISAGGYFRQVYLISCSKKGHTITE